MNYSWASYQSATSCNKHPKGMTNLMAYMLARFAYLRSMGICNCRSVNGGTARSHHSECRAGDIGIPTGPGGRYRPELGDPIIELLGPNGRRLGLDHLILNRVIYSAKSPDGRYYSGRHPHYDHAHAGINMAGADRLTMATLIDVLGDVGSGIPLPPGDDMAELDKWISDEQENLNAAGFKGANGKPLTVDGVNGANTKFARANRDLASRSGGGLHTHGFNGTTSQGG